MSTAEAMRWFKNTFHDQINTAVQGTPFTIDLLTAIAYQETGSIWGSRWNTMNTADLLAICVGDTLDSDRGRSAFPKTKADLLSKPNGAQMFDIARNALVNMSKVVKDYAPTAKNPNKFCHGYGIFQYDIQFFLSDPNYFLQQRYVHFEDSLQKAMQELKSKLVRIGMAGRPTLTDNELIAVAIAYNTGNYIASKGLKQGYFDRDANKYYGEYIADFLRISKTVAIDGQSPAIAPASTPGTAPISPPTPVSATGPMFEVDVAQTPLNVRHEPVITPEGTRTNVFAKLPDGHRVRAVSDAPVGIFREIETSLNGALIHGWASQAYLKPVADVDVTPIEPETPAPQPPTSGLVAVFAPNRSNVPVKRTAIANALSLNEPGQPTRTGDTADKRRAELAAIIEWLAVDKPAHKRYQPIPTATFCNIYAHDYCFLAGVYVPRVWWSSAAIEKLAQGQTVNPQLGNNIDEQRANDLFRWFRDFGLRFGWRRTGTLTKLQTEVNQGAIGIIVARRVEEGRSGHIVPVVPETPQFSAKRNSAGEVIAPLQSQAGARNFQYSTSTVDWWKDAKFAESAFWIHA